jgi:hypothetical protein
VCLELEERPGGSPAGRRSTSRAHVRTVPVRVWTPVRVTVCSGGRRLRSSAVWRCDGGVRRIARPLPDRRP